MFQITNFFSVLIPFYGMLGIWTSKVGYHNMWEFWLYNIVFGLFQAPYYAVSLPTSQCVFCHIDAITVCANHDVRSHAPRLRKHVLRSIRHHQPRRELPLPFPHPSFILPALYHLSIPSHCMPLPVYANKKEFHKSSIIGPNVIQAIINTSNNNWHGFPFLFAICACASFVICLVDVEKGRESCRVFERERKVDRISRVVGDGDAVVVGVGARE